MSHSEKNTSATDQLSALLSIEKSILEKKAQRRTCLQVQTELCIPATDKVAVAHLRKTYFGEKIGSLPCWAIQRDHQPVPNSPENTAHVIRQLGMVLRLNTLKNQVAVNNEPINDYDISRIQNECKRWGLNSTFEHINSVILETAAKSSFHPFKEFVESKPWDGHDHITGLFETLTLNSEFLEYREIYQTDLRRWIIGLIAKQYRPGSQNYVFVLQGPQGRQKDRWFQRLVPISGCYSEGEIDPSKKDHKFIHRDNVIYNVAEIDATIRKKDASALKQFLMLTSLNERQSYGKYPVHFTSGSSFCGSVNDPQFLNDPTGSRRFHVVPIERADSQHTVDIQQVYAQALTAFRQGEKFWFDEEETAARDEVNAQFQVEDRIDVIASRIESGNTPKTCTELLLEHGIERATHSQVVKLGIQLTKNGINSKTIKIRNSSLKHYYVKCSVEVLLSRKGTTA